MGILSDRLQAHHNGTEIRIEGSTTLTGGDFRLVIDNVPTDSATCSMGAETTLYGKVGEDPLELHIKQGAFGTKFKLLINGAEHPLEKLQ